MDTTPTRPRTSTARRFRRMAAVAGLSLSIVAGLGACSDDDTADDSAAAQVERDTTALVPDALSPSNADATIADDVCDAWARGTGAVHQAPEDPAEIQAFFDAEVLPHTQALVEGLDGDLAVAASAIDDSYRKLASSGDPSIMGAPELSDALSTVGSELHTGCDWGTVDLTAVEYAFEGVPESLAPGRYSFALTNEGVEEHEMVLFRRKDGVTESFEELSALGEAMMEKLEFTGVAFGGPDTTAYAAADLEPGTYFLVCFIPTGGGEDGPPHFMEGMQSTLQVG